jgi:DNA-binding beta-propeller fold protein YncE
MSRIDTLILLFGAAVAAALSGGYAFAQAGAAQAAAPELYQHDAGWLKAPEGRKMGQSINVDIDRDGRSVWVYDRCGRADCIGSKLDPIQKFDASGALLASFGAGMFNHPHGLYLDADGNVWVTDDHGGDGKGHQVFKFSPQGKVLLTLGQAGIALGPDTFNAPTDVTVAANGDVFVSDGHGGETNARIVKFTKDGRLIKTWGHKGAAPGDLDEPHDIFLGGSQNRIYVADRRNSRIQVFDQDGNFIAAWRQFGQPSSVFVGKDDMIYVGASFPDPTAKKGEVRGIVIGDARDGSLKAFIPDPADLDTVERGTSASGIAADDMGNIYAADVGAHNLRKYIRLR